MSETEFQFVDPTRKEIQLANGPVSVTGMGDLLIITFSQASPRVHGVGTGRSDTHGEAVVLSRVALSRQTILDLVRLIGDVTATGSRRI